jgi:hypothetical protein
MRAQQQWRIALQGSPNARCQRRRIAVAPEPPGRAAAGVRSARTLARKQMCCLRVRKQSAMLRSTAHLGSACGGGMHGDAGAVAHSAAPAPSATRAITRTDAKNAWVLQARGRGRSAQGAAGLSRRRRARSGVVVAES